MKYLVSTDLDGTLLDHHNYQWQAAKQALELCLENSIPVIFNTSKTQSEVAQLQSNIGITGPMVVENGSALILPKEYENSALNLQYLASLDFDDDAIIENEDNIQITFGAPREQLLAFIKQVRTQEKWQFTGFNDWSIDQIKAHTNLSHSAAELAANKLYSEPFIWSDTEQALDAFTIRAEALNFKILRGGRFYHLQGNTNKGLPIMWLKQHILLLYGANCFFESNQASRTQPQLICLGDSHNDIDMLNVADYPVCIRSPANEFPELQTNKKIVHSEGEGPIGWNESIIKILK